MIHSLIRPATNERREKHPVDEDVASANFFQENQLGAMVEE
jgi:hypothetical protein